MKKITAVLLTLMLICFNCNIIFASETAKEEITSTGYYDTWYQETGNLINATIPDIDWAIPKVSFINANSISIPGTISYPNYNDMAPGNFDLQWMFTPDDDKYETKTGVFHFYLWPPDTEEQKGKMPEETTEAPTVPSLTAISVQLPTAATYDINLNDKVSGNSYVWTSSNPDVVTVNSKNGLLKAVSEGTAVITCEITLPDGTIQTLTSKITVGHDDNFPVLTETQLDLETGDVFDINLENKIAKSKYRWVSSDREIIAVNSANGKVKAVSPGSAYVTCTITTPENQVIVLRADINVTAPAEVTE